jgi:hypothetical protein
MSEEINLVRFYLGRGGQAVVKMVDAEFEYTYEYQVSRGRTAEGMSLNAGQLNWPGLH